MNRQSQPHRDEPGQSEPTREKLLAMAYADGELEGEARREFEALLERRPDLVDEVTSHQRLLVLSRQAAGPEPMDHEWERLTRDPLHRLGIDGSLWLLGAVALGLLGYGVYAVATAADLAPAVRVLLGLLLVGTLALFLATLRARLRTLPYDPYRDLER